MPAKDYLVVSFLLTYKTQSDRVWDIRSSVCINYRKCVNVKIRLQQDFYIARILCPTSDLAFPSMNRHCYSELPIFQRTAKC